MSNDIVEKIIKSTHQEKIDYIKKVIDNDLPLKEYIAIYRKLKKSFTAESVSKKVALLSSFTFNQIKELLELAFYSRGIWSDVYVGGFNQYQQEILNPDSHLYISQPDLIALNLRLEDLFPKFCWEFHSLSVEELSLEKENILENFELLVRAVKKYSDAKLFIANFEYPANSMIGLHDSQRKDGQCEWVKAFNSELIKTLSVYHDVYVFDLNKCVYDFGRAAAYDDKMWYLARAPYSQSFLKYQAKKLAAYMVSSTDRKKCLVLDLDNTLWGGVLGEEGVDGIAIDQTYPGNVYLDIQRLVKELSQQGIILAINSKNNIEDVKEVFQKHPFFPLRWDDFAATRVNWKPKVENLVELSEEIGIGLDSMVFIDDSPFETEQIKAILPEVEVVSFSGAPLEKLKKIKNLDCFNTLYLTDEDLGKSKQYKAQAKRFQSKKKFIDIEDFYRSLEMQVNIRECDQLHIKRASQLTQKTNQFNLTTRRYSESEIKKFCDSSMHYVYIMNMRDKYGDNGEVGVAVIEQKEQDWYIDTLLMSCRVIGRTVETAFLAFLLKEAAAHSIRDLYGEFLPTRKNAQVKDLYKNHGFVEAESYWRMSAKNKIAIPEWIQLS